MPETSASMTIDELARRADLVVSTVRMYQNRGLLPPPEKRGRVGFYDEGHLARLALIAQLQERGFSLAGIKELLDGMEHGESLRAILGLGDGPSTWVAETPRTMTLAELAAQLPGAEFDLGLVQRVSDLGLVDFSDGSEAVVVRHPSFLHIGSQLAQLGVPAAVILDQYELLLADSLKVAERFTEVFRTHLWEPFVEDGMPAGRVTELVGALEQLGPLAEGVVVMTLRQAVQQLAEAFVDAEAERLGIAIPRPGASEAPGGAG